MRMTLQVQNVRAPQQHVRITPVAFNTCLVVCLTPLGSAWCPLACGVPQAVRSQPWLAACAAAISAAAVRNVGTVLDDNRHLLLSAQTLSMAWSDTNQQNNASVRQVQRSA